MDAESELALLVCGTAERRAAAAGRVRELAEGADGEVLGAVLHRQRLLELAGSRLIELAPNAFGESFRTRVAAARRVTAMLALAVDSVAQALQDALDASGIPNVPLKGTALARRLYSDMGLRSSADVDILVRPEDLREALAVARDSGYAPAHDPLAGGDLPELHYTLEPSSDSRPPVDLHWRVHWYETGFSRALLDSAAADRGPDRRPAPEYDLASLLLFFARDGFIGLRYPADIAAWWDAYGDELPPGGLSGVIADHPEVAAGVRAAAVASERLGGPPAAGLLGGEPSLSTGERRALAVLNWSGTGGQYELAVDRALVDWMLRPPGSTAAFVRRHLRPPPEVIARWYSLPEGARLRLRFWEAVHGPKHALRLAAAASTAKRRHQRKPRPRPQPG